MRTHEGWIEYAHEEGVEQAITELLFGYTAISRTIRTLIGMDPNDYRRETAMKHIVDRQTVHDIYAHPHVAPPAARALAEKGIDLSRLQHA